MNKYNIVLSYTDGKVFEYTVSEEDYRVDKLKELMNELISFPFEKENIFITIVHENGVSIISNEELRSVEFSNGVWELLNYEKNEINAYFGVDLGLDS